MSESEQTANENGIPVTGTTGNPAPDVTTGLRRLTSTSETSDHATTVLDWEEVSSEASDAINNVVDNIIDRMRIERMFELRRLQHGDRAVSSSNTREQLEEMLNRSPETIASMTRPENIRAELEELSRNRSVVSLLSTRFRTVLESSLSIPRAPTNQTRQPQPVATPNIQNSNTSTPPAPPAPTVPYISTAERLDHAATARQLPQTEETEERIEELRQQADAIYQPPEEGGQLDYAITNVEELFQRRLVSDVLHSTFRNVLELHIERRLLRHGIQPRQRYVPIPTASGPMQQQPQPPVPPAPQVPGSSGQPAPFNQSAPSYNPFLIPAAARRLPELERQVHVMSIEIKEMKGMLKLLVDTNLDIQRSIRQEVNALITNSNVVPEKPTKPLKQGCCAICLEAPSDTVLYRCGHLCLCYGCARQLKVEGHHCPVCRANVTDILRVYKSTDNN